MQEKGPAPDVIDDLEARSPTLMQVLEYAEGEAEGEEEVGGSGGGGVFHLEVS